MRFSCRLGALAAMAVSTMSLGACSGTAQPASGPGILPAGTTARPLPMSRRSQEGPETENTLYSFGANRLSEPVAGLIADSHGALYGTTWGSSCGNYYGVCGGVFKLTPTGSGFTETDLYIFSGGPDGGSPIAPLYMDSSGALYGTTLYGGNRSTCPAPALGCGVVFKLSPSGSGYTESTLYAFQGGTDGQFPFGGVILDASGSVYGTVQEGGGYGCGGGGCGAVFKLTKKATGYKKILIHRFDGSDGQWPIVPALYMDGSGALYGTTAYGGTNSCPSAGANLHLAARMKRNAYTLQCGNVFKLTPKGGNRYKEKVLYNFKGGSDGKYPFGGVVGDSHGSLYGTTTRGGGGTQRVCYESSQELGCGTVFKLTRKGKRYQESVLYAFNVGGSGFDGYIPNGAVIVDSSGAVYSTTMWGGCCSGSGGSGGGTVFKLKPKGTRYKETLLWQSPLGYAPSQLYAGLIELNGTFYTTSAEGGDYRSGTVFSLTP